MEKVIKTEARLTEAARVNLDGQITGAFAEQMEKLVLDMEDTEYISSACLRCVLKAMKMSRAKGVSFVIRNVKPAVLEIFEITGFASGLNIE